MLRMLIADDEPGARQYLERALDWSELGIEVIASVENGLEAFRIIETQTPDLALLDINMPGMTGLDIAEQIQLRFPGLVFALVTAYADFSYAQAAVHFGAGEYLLKPFSPGQLQATMEHLLRLTRAYEGQAQESERAKIHSAPRVWHVGAPLPAQTGERARKIVAGVDRYLKKHYMEPRLSVQEIADSLFLDVSYVRRIFSGAVGCTLVDYLTEYRILEAGKLLSDPAVSISEAAERVGYMDPGYFTKCFKRYFHVTPSAYQSRGAQEKED